MGAGAFLAGRKQSKAGLSKYLLVRGVWPGWGFNLPGAYVIWAGIVAAMYPLCARVALRRLQR